MTMELENNERDSPAEIEIDKQKSQLQQYSQEPVIDSDSDHLALINELREKLSDLPLREEDVSDSNLIKWLIARNWNFNLTEKMFRKSFKWRIDNEVDYLKVWESPEEFGREYPYEIAGTTLEGYTVIFCKLGIWDIRSVIQKEENYKEYTLKYIIQVFELALEKSPSGKIIFVLDMDRLKYSNLGSTSAISVMLSTVKIFESNYPETLQIALMINSPFIFSHFFNLAKPFITGTTLKKVSIYKTSDESWRLVLAELIPSELLPQNYNIKESQNI